MKQEQLHEIANHLMSSSFNLDYLLKTCENQMLKSHLKSLKSSLNSLSEICGLNSEEKEMEESCTISEMIEELELQSKGFFEKKKVNLIKDFSLSSLGFFENRYCVQNTLLNLLKNAAENSFESGTVLFKGYCKDNSLVFIVENLNGPHFDPSKSYSRTENGHPRGLGLRIIKKNLAKLGGSFFPVKSTGGMRMKITLPVNLIKASKVLLVDDDPNFNDAASMWLKHLGFSVTNTDHTAENIKQEDYGFAIVDVGNGMGFAFVKKHNINADKVIFISGSEDMLEVAKKRGFKTALKGCSLNPLMEHIGKVA